MGYRSALQRVSSALMFPIIILPVAAIYFAIGTQTQIPAVLAAGKAILLTYLPLIFAIGIALGFCEQDGIAGLSAAIGWIVMSEVLKTRGAGLDAGVLGGIVIGGTASVLWHRFRHVRFPEWAGLFSGKRFIPLLTSLAALILGIVLGFIWPPVQQAIRSLGEWVFAAGAAGVLVYGIVNRLLIPTGLHHIMQNLIEYVLGSYVASGKALQGEVTRFFAGDPKSGFILAGYYIVMMFSVPAACLAITHEARPENRKRVGGLMGTAALSSALLGITEPAEFSFMFSAPILYAVHAVLTGLALWVSWTLGIRHWGYALPLYIANWGLATKAWLILPVGAVFAVVYYTLFRFLIRRLDLPTLGRREALSDAAPAAEAIKSSPRGVRYVAALGGAANIATVGACVTRLRLLLHHPEAIDEKALRSLGASGISRLGGGNLQVVIGTQAEAVRDEIRALLKGSPLEVTFVAPLTGRLMPLTEVPDQVFAAGMVGDGFAIDPTEGRLVSPVAGNIIQVFPGGHAIVLAGPAGLEIILHIGLDTVELDGRGFTVRCQAGQAVQAGETLAEFDLQAIQAAGKSAVSPCVITNRDILAHVFLNEPGSVTAGVETVLRVSVR